MILDEATILLIIFIIYGLIVFFCSNSKTEKKKRLPLYKEIEVTDLAGRKRIKKFYGSNDVQFEVNLKRVLSPNRYQGGYNEEVQRICDELGIENLNAPPK